MGTLEGVEFVRASWVRFREEMSPAGGWGESRGDVYQRSEQRGVAHDKTEGFSYEESLVSLAVGHWKLRGLNVRLCLAITGSWERGWDGWADANWMSSGKRLHSVETCWGSQGSGREAGSQLLLQLQNHAFQLPLLTLILGRCLLQLQLQPPVLRLQVLQLRLAQTHQLLQVSLRGAGSAPDARRGPSWSPSPGPAPHRAQLPRASPRAPSVRRQCETSVPSCATCYTNCLHQ